MKQGLMTKADVHFVDGGAAQIWCNH